MLFQSIKKVMDLELFFEMNPQKVTLSDAEYAEIIEKIKVQL